MERVRNVPIALKTTSEIKDGLNLLTDRMSSQAGYVMTQTQVIEKLISDALRTESADEELIERKGFVANHMHIMNMQKGHSVKLQIQTQLNANRLADLLGADIDIKDMTSAITMNEGYGKYRVVDSNGETVFLDTDGGKMFNVLRFLLGAEGTYQFKNQYAATYYNELVSLLRSYVDTPTLCDNSFSIIASDNVLMGMGYAPYLGREMRDKGVTNKDVQAFQSVLDALLRMAFDNRVYGCKCDEYVVRVLPPKSSIYMPDVGDGMAYTMTILLLPYEYSENFPLF